MHLFNIIIFIIGFSYLAMVGLFLVGYIRLSGKSNPNQFSAVPISVVIAVRNEEDNICNLLSSLTTQGYPKSKFEIVLVNDHSTDTTWQKAKRWIDRIHYLTLLELPHGITGKKQAISLGVAKAKNNCIVFTDADCIHPSAWLQAIAAHYHQLDLGMLIGPVILSPSNSFFERMQALEHSSLTASSIGACAMGIPFMASSANLAFDRERLAFRIQMLKPSHPSGDDVFLLHSAKHKKDICVGCIHEPNALVRTKPARSINEFFRQRARWASKSWAYSDLSAIIVGLIVLLSNMILFILIITVFWVPNNWRLLALGYAAKTIVDLPLLWVYLNRYSSTSLLKVFIPLQGIYPIYIVFTFALSIWWKTNWKDRRGEGNSDRR